MCSNIFDCQYDSQINKSGTTEFQVDLIPNNLIDSNICTVSLNLMVSIKCENKLKKFLILF